MTDGEIYGNDAGKHGGAIQILGMDTYVSNFEMSGGVIKKNHCNKYGGGLTVSDYSRFTMSGNAMIINNSTEGAENTPGGGVAFADRNTSMTVSGDVKIFGNTRAGNNDNLHIGSNSCNRVMINSMDEGAKIGVTCKGGTGDFGITKESSAKDRFFSDADLYEVVADGSTLSLSQALLKITSQPEAPDYPAERSISVSVDREKQVSYQWYTWHEDGSVEEAPGAADAHIYNIPAKYCENQGGDGILYDRF